MSHAETALAEAELSALRTMTVDRRFADPENAQSGCSTPGAAY
jgi:hypothetical protein